MNRSAYIESVIGLIVLAVAGAFLYYAYGVSGATTGADSYRIGAVFGRVDGVTVGAEVRIAGVKVGAVSGNGLNVETYEADIELMINGDVPIPEDSVAKVVADGLLGGVHIAIEPGASEIMLEPGDKITITQGSVDLLGLAVQAFTSPNGGSSNAGEADAGGLSLDPLGDM